MYDHLGEILLAAVILDAIALLVIALFGHMHWLTNRRIQPNAKDGAKTWSNWMHNAEVHTVPDNDIYTHEYEDCGCSPQTVPVARDDGSYGWQVIHNAMDGRTN